MNNKSISIVYPAFNEQANIEGTITKSFNFAKKNFEDFEIIIVDDGSRDKTNELATALAKKFGRIKVLKNSKNLGYGATVWKGLKSASKDLVYFSDSDQQFDISELRKFLKQIEKYDVVIGYRKDRKDPFMRKVNMWGWKIIIRTMLGLKVKDVDCAFKLFKRDVFKKIKIDSQGATFSAELMYKIKKLGYSILELPVSHYPRKAGNPTGAKIAVIKKAFVEIWNLYKKDEKLVRSRSAIIYVLALVVLFASRLFMKSNSLDFFDSSEYMWRTNDASLFKAMATGHAPFHPLYVFFGWLLHHSVFHFSEVVSLELTSAILGSASLVFLFLFIKKLFNPKVAWLSSTIFALLPFVWVSQITVLVDASEHAFYFLGLYLWLIALESRGAKGRIGALSAGLSFGLAAFSHTQVAIWGLSVIALPIATIKKFDKTEIMDLISKFILFLLGGALFIYFYLELLLFSNSIGWHDKTDSYKSAFEYLVFGNIGDHDAVEIRKVVYYLVSLASSLVVLTAGLGLLKMFFKEKRKLLFIILWFVPFIIGSTYIYENLYTRTLIIGLAPVAVLSAYFIINLRRKNIIIAVILAQLLVLSVPVALRYRTAPAPIEHIKDLVADLEPGGIFISSNLTKTMANSAYNGEFVNFGDVGNGAGYVEEKVAKALNENKPVYILSDALILPFRRYDGMYYDLRSSGTGNASRHGSILENLQRKYNIDLVKRDDFKFKRSVYKISNRHSGDWNSLKEASKKSPLIFGKLISQNEPVTGAIINNYAKNFCGTVKENITRLDLGFCLLRTFSREEPENWSFTDQDGWFYLPSDTAKPVIKIGLSPGQSRVKYLNGEFVANQTVEVQPSDPKEFTDLEELKKSVGELKKPFYVVAEWREKEIYKLFTFDFELPVTNKIFANDLEGEAGKLVKDSVSSNGYARVSDERSGYLTAGPYAELLAGKYTLRFSVRSDEQLDMKVNFDIPGEYGKEKFAEKELTVGELKSDEYKNVDLDFELTQKQEGVEFRVKSPANSTVKVEFIELLKR